MPLSVVPSSVPEPGEASASPEPGTPEPESPSSLDSPSGPPERDAEGPTSHSTSRWIDYDTHELLEMISELEDERRWARLREGVLWAVLLHALVILGLFLLPKYVFVPRVIEQAITTKDKEWTYLDSPPVPLKPPAPKPLITPPKPPRIDQKTLEELRKADSAPVEQPKMEAPAQPKPPAPAPPVAPTPQTQSQIEAPQPKAVPARPNFAMGSQNPADQLREAMRNASRGPANGGQAPSGGLARHPGAGTGGVQVLSDMQGVDFSAWLHRWYFETEHTWDPLIPDEVNPPIYKSGAVQVRFKVLPNGQVMQGSMVLEGRSGDTALDRAAWGAITGSNYPALPRDFHGPFLELRAQFLYNMRPQE